MEIGYSSSMYGELYELLFSPESEENIIVNAKYSPLRGYRSDSPAEESRYLPTAVYGGLEQKGCLSTVLTALRYGPRTPARGHKEFYEFAKKTSSS